MGRIRTASLAATTVALAALTALFAAGGAGAQDRHAVQAAKTKCATFNKVQAIKINNVEAIIDDSGSMKDTDPNRLRVAGLELFISNPANANKTLGVVEFGTAADTVFGPGKVGPNADFMISQLRAKVNHDNGGTTYDAGFNKGRSDNPGAQARIFLTDGADYAGFTNTHRGGPRTFVVGLGIGKPGPDNPTANNLQRIADETGGVYFPNVTSATLQPTFRTISSAVNCLKKPRTFRSGLFTKKGQKSRRTATITPGTKHIELGLSWAQPLNRFTYSSVVMLGKKGKVLATLTGKGKPKKLKVKKVGGKTFRSFSFKKTRGATKVRFTVKAKKLVKAEHTITQLTESK